MTPSQEIVGKYSQIEREADSFRPISADVISADTIEERCVRSILRPPFEACIVPLKRG
jgi:hypothetical protein